MKHSLVKAQVSLLTALTLSSCGIIDTTPKRPYEPLQTSLAVATPTATETASNVDPVQSQAGLTSSPEAAPQTAFRDGTYRVGTDISPGTYLNAGLTERCYWVRLSGFSGTVEDIIANDNPQGQAFVTIDSSDKAFTSYKCGTWTMVE